MLDLFTSAKRAPGECLISIDGSEITDLYPFLMEVTVDASRTDAAEAVLKFETRRDVDGSWIVQDDDRIRPWKAIIIMAAFGEETEEVMRGYVREVQVELPEDAGGAQVTVTAQDESLLLDRTHKRRPWGAETPTTDMAIATAIIDEHDLTPEVPPGPGQSNLVVNQDETDVKFLKKRAEANGYELIFREGMVYFGPLRFGGDPQATIMVYAGPKTNCRTFNIVDDGHQPDRVTYEIAAETGAETETATLTPDLDPLGPEPATSEALLDDGFVWRVSREGVAESGQMRDTAQQKANEASLKVKAEGTLDGALYGHVLKVGLTVGVDGVGTRHSGTWYVNTVNHTFDIDGYRQDFALLRNTYGDNLATGSNPLAAVV
jgi:phage protein D